ncbi:MAG: hypothetical protein P1U63_01815 [Coxiellaceae bacterium]|nr:hypothetical protein [Coxiellaceae bacterium]
MNEEQARQFIRALFRMVWERRDKSKIPTFYAASLTGFVDQLPLKIRDIYAGVDYIEKNCYSNVYSLHDLVVSGNKIAAVINVKTISIDQESERYTSIAYFFELEKGKIIKLRMYAGQTQVSPIEEESSDPSGSLISRAVDAVSNFSKSKKEKTKVAVEKKQKPSQVKTTAVKEQEPSVEQPVKRKQPPAKKRAAKDQKSSVKQPTVENDYSASPQPAFSFNKAKLQVGVNPANHRKDKDSE